MLHVLIAIGAFASGGAVGSVTVGGYVPATCRAGDPLAGASAATQPPGGNCTAAAVTAQVYGDGGEDAVIRITVTPR